MIEPQAEVLPIAEQPCKAWVAPTFERTPLNEAMSGTHPAAYDGVSSFS